MSKFEILSLIITIVCLTSFCIVFTILFRNYNLNAIKDVKQGKEDIELIDNVLLDEKKKKTKKTKTLKIIGRVTYYILYIIVFTFFSFSLVSRILDNSMLFNNSGFVVIASGSMSEKHQDNKYLFDNNLNDQIDTYDIIGISKYNKIEDVKLYDIIAFKDKTGRTIVHRIVSLKENELANNIEIVTKGDASSTLDNYSLYDNYLNYEDIIGHYNHKKVPLIGSFVIFLQSNSGIITILSIGYCVVMFDFYRNKLEKAILERTNLLIELIDYDVSNPSLTNYFKQELVYRGYKYIFNEGNFIEKIKIDDSNIQSETENMMYSKLESNSHDSSILIKDITKDEIKKINEDSIVFSNENQEEKEESIIDLIKKIINKKNKQTNNEDNK